MVTSNLHKWDQWNSSPGPYIDTPTYRMGADWLADCALVEDWGCGRCWARNLIGEGRYRGIDGSVSPDASELADLAEYRSQAPGIFMRHVLEHNFAWQAILDNALASFTERMALILFTPFSVETHDIEFEDPPGVPNLSFRLQDLTDRIETDDWSLETLPSTSKYGVEAVLRLER